MKVKFGVVILAGGKSRRMGRDKAELEIKGIRFLDKLVEEFSRFGEVLVSVDDEKEYSNIPYPMVRDVYSDCGPMGGLYSALMACRSDALVVVPCDVPFFSGDIAEKMCLKLEEGIDAVIAVTEDGRMHPLCGVYRKTCLKEMGENLKNHRYKMQDLLFELSVIKYEAGHES